MAAEVNHAPYSANFEAREIALKEFAGYLDVRACSQTYCASCSVLGAEREQENDSNCTEQCEKNCAGKAFFTADQIFYVPETQNIWRASSGDPGGKLTTRTRTRRMISLGHRRSRTWQSRPTT